MKIMKRVYVFTNANDVLHSDVSKGRMATLWSSGGASFVADYETLDVGERALFLGLVI